MHQSFIVLLLPLLNKQGMQCKLSFEVEWAHYVRAFEVLILVFHHIDDIVNFLLLIELEIFFLIEADVILESPRKQGSEGPVHHWQHHFRVCQLTSAFFSRFF